MLKTTTGYEPVDGYVGTYGFCHWQAQEVIKARNELLAALERIAAGSSDEMARIAARAAIAKATGSAA